jgi:tetratricopeptide (TPR) repeat protein
MTDQKIVRHKKQWLIVMAFCSLASAVPAMASSAVEFRGDTRQIQRPKIPISSPGALDPIQKGLAKFDAGDLRGAIVELNQAILKDNTSSQAYMYRGLVRETMGDYINAMADFEQNRIAPCLPMTLSEKGYCETQLSDFHAALTDLNNSLGFDSSSQNASLAFVRRAIVKRKLHDPAGAIADCDRSMHIVNNLDALFQQALALCDVQQYQSALDKFNAVVQAQPRFADGHFALAQCLIAMGRPKDALPELQRAANLYSEYHDDEGHKLAMKKIAELSSL